jgi:hypothetical protein
MALWEIAASLNLPVFPCNYLKVPCNKHAFKEAVTDKYEIKELFNKYKYSAALIGVPTGERIGFDIFDLDTKKHPEEVRIWLKDHKHLIPQTRAHKTESGGVHYLFNHYKNLKLWNAVPVPGVDGRANGGYAIWWPAAGYEINDKPILDWPEELVTPFYDHQNKNHKKKIGNGRPLYPLCEPMLEKMVKEVARASEGTRNHSLFVASCRVGEWIKYKGFSASAGESALLWAAQHAGLNYNESIATIHSGFNR